MQWSAVNKTKKQTTRKSCSSCAFGFLLSKRKLEQSGAMEHLWAKTSLNRRKLGNNFCFSFSPSQMNCHCSHPWLHSPELRFTASDMQFESISLSRHRPSSARFPQLLLHFFESSSSFDVLFMNKLGRNSDGNLAARGWLGGRCVIINYIWWHGSERVHFWLRFFAPASQLLVQLTSGVNWGGYKEGE